MDLFDLFCRIVLNDEDYQRGLDSAKKGTKSFAKDAGKTISAFAKKAEKALKTAAKIGTAAITAASTGVGLLVKSAVQEYANYEQLVGGVETLFKDAADTVQKYADNAYKTAGLSANEYMETVTSFSASLLQSLGGDTAAAAEKADRAITDMSDNANKMGTDMTAIQNAYQGFAKQNYTMLDNLKLGYGGTQQEMQRLLDDANALNAAQGKLTNYSIESYADIVDAIHDVQTQMGITGTTAKEAATTIQGSVNSAKSAWHNLLIGVADDNQDFDELVDQFVDSVDTAADNILPRVEKSLNGILKLVTVASEKIVPRVIATLSEQAPALIEAGADIILALGEGIVNNADQIFNSVERIANRLIPKIAQAFNDLVPKVARSAARIIKELNGIAEIVGGLTITIKSLLKGNWIGVGIGAIVAVIGEARRETAAATKAAAGLTDEQWDMVEAGEAAAEALMSVTDARDDGIKSIETETEKTQDLWKELQNITDENGNVLAGQEKRADFLLGELNEALGTEYERNGDIIEQYQQMQDEIDNLINKRRAERLLQNADESYDKAKADTISLQATANEYKTAVENAQAEIARYDALVDDRIAAFARADRAVSAEEAEYWRSRATEGFETKRDALFSEWEERGFSYADLTLSIEDNQKKYEEAAEAANEAARIILNYEEAYNAIAEGRYKDASELLMQGSSYNWKYLSEQKKASEKELRELQEAINTQKAAVNNYKRELEAGTYGYTADTLEDMQNTLNEMLSALDAVAGDAYSKGAAIALGLKNGFISKSGELIKTVNNTVDDIVRGIQRDFTPSPYSPNAAFDFGERSAGGSSGSSSSSRAESPSQITINVHADTDDLGEKIARELQSALDGVLAARGNSYRNGRTGYAY